MLPPPLPDPDVAEVAPPPAAPGPEAPEDPATPYLTPSLAALGPVEPAPPTHPRGWPYTLASPEGPPHPVAWSYGARYRALLAEAMGGPQAPSTLGPTVAEADVYWRFQLGNAAGMPLPEDAAERWRDTALSGAILATSRLLDETVARAPELTVYRSVLDGLINPNLSVHRDDDGTLSVEHRTGGRRARRIEAAELTESTPDESSVDPADPTATSSTTGTSPTAGASSAGRPPGARGSSAGPRRPEPDLGVGIDWHVRDEEDPRSAPFLSYGLWVSGTRIGLSNLRATYSFFDQSWSAVARQEVYPRVYLYGNVASAPSAVDLGRVSGGLLWALPWGTGWTLRLDRAQTLPAGGEAGIRWMILLRGEQHTEIPARDGTPLGEGGLCQPPLAPRGPNRWAPMTPPDPAWPLPQNCDRTGYSPRE